GDDVDAAFVYIDREGLAVEPKLRVESQLRVDDAAAGNFERHGDRSPVAGLATVWIGWQSRAKGRQLVEEIGGARPARAPRGDRHLVGTRRPSNELSLAQPG